jgi:hypothetical protein
MQSIPIFSGFQWYLLLDLLQQPIKSALARVVVRSSLTEDYSCISIRLLECHSLDPETRVGSTDKIDA